MELVIVFFSWPPVKNKYFCSLEIFYVFGVRESHVMKLPVINIIGSHISVNMSYTHFIQCQCILKDLFLSPKCEEWFKEFENWPLFVHKSLMWHVIFVKMKYEIIFSLTVKVISDSIRAELVLFALARKVTVRHRWLYWCHRRILLIFRYIMASSVIL